MGNTGLLLLTKLWEIASQKFSCDQIFPLNAEDIQSPRAKVSEEKTIVPFALFCLCDAFGINGIFK